MKIKMKLPFLVIVGNMVRMMVSPLHNTIHQLLASRVVDSSCVDLAVIGFFATWSVLRRNWKQRR
eukprot:3147752-Amphidinium_carterae.1